MNESTETVNINQPLPQCLDNWDNCDDYIFILGKSYFCTAHDGSRNCKKSCAGRCVRDEINENKDLLKPKETNQPLPQCLDNWDNCDDYIFILGKSYFCTAHDGSRNCKKSCAGRCVHDEINDNKDLLKPKKPSYLYRPNLLHTAKKRKEKNGIGIFWLAYF